MASARLARSRIRILALVGAGALAACAAFTSLTTTASASSAEHAATASDGARPWIVGNHTVPYFSMADAIEEQVDVEVGTDRDHDGKGDTIRVDISRPDTGKKVPLIIHASPYFFGAQDRGMWETD